VLHFNVRKYILTLSNVCVTCAIYMFKAYVLLIPIYTTVTLVEHVYIYPREYAEFFKLEFYVASLGRAFCFKLARIWRNWKHSMRRRLEFEFL